LSVGRRYAEENGIGVAISLLLHGLAVFLVLFSIMNHSARVPSGTFHVVPVDVIRLGEETRSPPAEQHSVVPQQRAGRPQQEASPTREAVSPTGTNPAPADALDAKLRALARLKQPETKLAVAEGQGVSNVDASNGAPGNTATYSIRDYVLAQVLRRWTLDLSRTDGRALMVPIRVTMKRDGTIASAEIVETARAKIDVVYRDIAIGARNAVLLSSPIVLPAGDYPKEMHFTLKLDTRAVVR
jgi:hypothetical protein